MTRQAAPRQDPTQQDLTQQDPTQRDPASHEAVRPEPARGVPTERDLVAWLKTYLADLLDVEACEIGTDLPWESLGVDSATTLVLSADLSAYTGRETGPFEILEHPTVDGLAHYLAAEPPVAEPPVAESTTGAVAR